jgi:hypothetical protein
MESLKANLDAPASDGTPLPGDVWPELPPELAAFADAYTQWKDMQALEIVPPKFEDYLKTFGIRPPASVKEEAHNPELLRYVRSFKQPANTVGETGAVNSQVVWDVAERADKDRFFAEPGFVVGIHTARAKMYCGKQNNAFAHHLADGLAWLPALLAPDPFTSLKKFLAASGPLDGQTDDYWVDLADLFVGGDQFTNYTRATDPGFSQTPVPGDAGAGIAEFRDYAFPTDVDALFVNAAGGKNLVRLEGRVDLSILSRVQDTTP